MAGRDNTWDSEGDTEPTKRLQPGYAADEQVRKSVGVFVYVRCVNFQGPPRRLCSWQEDYIRGGRGMLSGHWSHGTVSHSKLKRSRI